MEKGKKKIILSSARRYKHLTEKYEKYAGDISNIQLLMEEMNAYDIVQIDRNEDAEAIDILKKQDESTIKIRLGENVLWNWKCFSEKVQHIKSLVIIGHDDVTNDIFRLENLVDLQLLGCRLRACDLNEIDNLRELKYLVLDESEFQDFPVKIYNLKQLQTLSAMNTGVDILTEDIGNLTNLTYLGLNHTKTKKIPKVIGQLENLTSLYLGMTEVSELPDTLRNLKKLEYLALWETPLMELPEWICELSELKGLFLGRARKISFLPEKIGKLKKLQKLYIDATAIKELPESFGELTALEELQVGNTAIRRFPNMEKLKNLHVCNLDNMTLERIPIEFINSDMEIRMEDDYSENVLSLYKTRLLCQPISLFTHEKDFIRSYYAEKKIHLNETKVVFLGDGEAGKSHIIERIKEDNYQLKQFQQESTPGIAISQKHCTIEDENVCLQIWDFGGQEIMHSMHRFFLTERTLYVVVVNARDNTQDERAKYWLNNVKNFANGCPVIIVLNKMDQNPTASINERLLMDDYPQIIKTLKISALNDSKEKFSQLTKTIISIVKTFDSYAMDFPISWNNIKMILTEMKENYITDPLYRKICCENGVEDEQIQNWLLDWFHDLGVSFNYRKKDELLGGYMVLKPTWITNAIYVILFNGREYSNNGIISIANIIELLKKPPRAVTDIMYNITEVPYILGVMRRFEISYSIDDKYEFIPMMCDRNQHEDAALFMQKECLEYYMEYEYLPNNVLHKLMIKMQDDLDKSKIWLTGAILYSCDENISALVRMHNNRIEIYINSTDNVVYPKKEYLNEIRKNLLNINRELNLKAEDTIVYKENGISEEIKYETLLVYLSAKEKSMFSVKLKKLVPIKKILGIVENEMDSKLIIEYCQKHEEVTYALVNSMLAEAHTHRIYEELQRDIEECCMKIQGNTLQILRGKENDRNTYLRDLLSVNKRYILCDQTLNGLSAKKKNAGELDLLIKDNNQNPIAVLEALTLDSVDKNYISEHIKKLFTYDTWGLENNYIICYVEKTKNFKEFCERYKKYIEDYNYPYSFLDMTCESNYAEISVYHVILQRNAVQTEITHILVNLVYSEGTK